MPLFQNTVLKKYITIQDKSLIGSKWELFQTHFHNPVIQENIRNSKEEQYQGEFLIDLFVKVLGYTKNPEPDFNLTTEYKNVKDSKKADGAIIIDNKVRAVVELKGTETTDLSRIETQAFGYKNNQPNCTYVITSNFEKLRFYIDNTVNFIEFQLFELNETEFEILYLCLGFENIAKDLPQTINKESLSQEDEITKQLYKDYSQFKTELHKNLVLLNPEFNALTLFKKSQKLLDRFLFLFFAEDRLLLPPNSVRLVLSDWRDLMEKDVDTTLYKRFQKYFGYLNTGFKGKRYNVFAYNGGLFKPDEVLEVVNIDDELLYKHTLRLSEYDFESEVDVNILGHIFENSLTEIEEVQAELEGVETDKTKSKRKKDGVFYTPKYITKYIVENTVGKLCEEKKIEFDITDENYQPAKQRSRKRLDNLQQYRDWLLQVTICDPACGSGAFLNQALEFLIAEHRYIDELSAKYNKDALILSDVENSILENNLFGVDINEESVEIAKLSLWLRTAQKNRKLNDLSSNIKCGNSLIDDIAVAEEKAFDWEKEFPQIFEKGGFDVVIGNPPYVRNELISQNDKEYFDRKFQTYTGKSDLYVFFFERAYQLINSNGEIGFIVSSKYTKTKYGKVLIDFLQNNTHISSFIDFKDLDVFEGIIAYPSIILFNKKIDQKTASKLLVVSNENYSEIENQFINSNKVNQSELFDKLGSWNSKGATDDLFQLLKKLNKNNPKLSELNIKPQVGIKTGLNSVYIFSTDNIPETISKNNLLENYVIGREVKRYNTIEGKNKVLFPYKRIGNNLNLIENIEENISAWEYLNEFKEKLSNRAIIKDGIKNGSKFWYQYQQIKLDFDYQEEYIIYPDISSDVNFTLVKDALMDMTCFGIPSNSKSLLGILNSKLIKTILEIVCVKARGGYLRLKNQYILNLPIPKNFEKQSISVEVEKNLDHHSKLKEVIDRLQRTIQRKFLSNKDSLSKKLENWYELTFAEFIEELGKKKIKLSLSEEAEWEVYFLTEKKKTMEIKNQITSTDDEIDALVYELYGLTEEEINTVENLK